MVRKHRHNILNVIGTIILSIALNGCSPKRSVIRVPEDLNVATRMPVMGGERSWRLGFGPYDVYNIQERTGQAMMSLLQSRFYDIQAFEFLIKDNIGNQWTCWCEYPERQYWELQLKCVFQESQGIQRGWSLNDGVVAFQDREIVISDYFQTDRQERRKTSALMGYTFSTAGQVIGLVDISGTSGYEAVWIHPNTTVDGKMAIAAASAAIILKHRKWYHERTLRLLESSE